jgi:hypothetical protein
MDREGTGTPSTSVIIAVAVMLAAVVLVAFGIHRILSTGTCSSTGYTSFGPVPRCPKGSFVFALFLTFGIVAAVIAGLFVAGGQLVGPAVFLAIGLGALTAGVFPSAGNGSPAFGYVFGGCFALGGIAWAVYALRSMHLGPAPITGRSTLAGFVWVAAIGAAVGGGLIADHAAGTRASSVDLTRASAPRDKDVLPTGATDLLSMFKATNLAPVLRSLETRFGSDAEVVQLSLYPEQLDLVIAAHGSARLITADVGGVLNVSPPQSFAGSRQAVSLSQIPSDVPGHLAQQIATRDGVPIDRIDHFALDLRPSLAHWGVYTSSNTETYTALLTGGQLQRVGARAPQQPAS